MEATADGYDVFICYSRRNQRFAQRLANDLRENQLVVWIDSIELTIGDAHHLEIERGIETSRYFCAVLSPGWMDSYYAREIEFEMAFSKMTRDRRSHFILPLLYQVVQDPLPPRLAGRFYLDFTNRRRYFENVIKLVNRIKLPDHQYSGTRWYRAFQVTPLGHIVGIGELRQVNPTGGSVEISFRSGVVTGIDIYVNSELVNYKRFTFDEVGRVHENLMYTPAGEYIDTWRYYYDSVTGRKIRKVIDKPGARSRREIYYDGHNREVEEKIVTLDGKADTSFGYTRKTFEYDTEGQVRITVYDEHDRPLTRPHPDKVDTDPQPTTPHS